MDPSTGSSSRAEKRTIQHRTECKRNRPSSPNATAKEHRFARFGLGERARSAGAAVAWVHRPWQRFCAERGSASFAFPEQQQQHWELFAANAISRQHWSRSRK